MFISHHIVTLFNGYKYEGKKWFVYFLSKPSYLAVLNMMDHVCKDYKFILANIHTYILHTEASLTKAVHLQILRLL